MQDGSVLIFNPLPKNISIDKNLVEKWIKKSVEKAKKNMIKGKELTPYLIQEINSLSNNQTLKTNMEIIINNALIAGRLAFNFYKIK